MKFISATYNGEAYALTGTTTLTTDANTTVKVNGKEQTTIPENTSANYNVEYTVNYIKDGTTIATATKTIKVSVVDKAAVDAVVAKINAISTATKGDYVATVNAARDAYNKLDKVNQDAIPQSTYKILRDAIPAAVEQRASEIKDAVKAHTPSQSTYTYQGTIAVDGTAVTATGKDSGYMTKSGSATTPAVADLAQFLGGLYKSDEVESIEFNGTTYTWDKNGTLAGSNWKNGTTTLVSAIVSSYTSASTKPSEVTLTLNNDLASVDITYTIKIAE